MTLEEMMKQRQSKFDTWNTPVDFWKGYYSGWYNAYKDMMEILDQCGFDISVIVMEEKNV